MSSAKESLTSSFEELLILLIEQLKISRERKFIFLLVGRTGVGKSSTVNSLMGQIIAPVGKYDATTMEVISYEREINDRCN